jgi:Xaa-Pro aminopeptidase
MSPTAEATRPAATVHSQRTERVRSVMAARDLPALLLTDLTNIGWISGFTGSNAFVILTRHEAVFATDSRYASQAASQCPDFRLHILPTSAADDVTTLLGELNEPIIGFEASHLTVQMHEVYRERLAAGIQFLPTTGIIEGLRLIKDETEIAAMEAACEIADRAWEHIVPFLRPGAVERDVMLELEWFIRKEGGAEVAFDTIVASGPRSALPHGRAAARTMQQGDFVTLDFGARLNGYCSDITRTVVLGQPSAEQRRIYETVLEALYRSIDAIRPGTIGKDIDAVAREIITDAGYGDRFGHGLGHSLGRAVHDGQGLNKRSELELAPGMVMTVEPGIYIPDWGGVRVEHDVLVTETGCRVLSKAPTDLLSL